MVANSENKQVMSQLPEIQKLVYDHVFNQGRVQERQRILFEIEKIEAQSHATKTPIYQETMFAKIKEILAG